MVDMLVAQYYRPEAETVTQSTFWLDFWQEIRTKK